MFIELHYRVIDGEEDRRLTIAVDSISTIHPHKGGSILFLKEAPFDEEIVTESYDEVKELIKKGRTGKGLTYTTLDDLEDPPKPSTLNIPLSVEDVNRTMYIKESVETTKDKLSAPPWEDLPTPNEEETLEDVLTYKEKVANLRIKKSET